MKRYTAKPSVRGAARVSVVWLIGVVVVLLAALGLAFVAYDAAGKLKTERDLYRVEAEQAKEAKGTEASAVAALSSAVGWYDRQVPAARTNLDTLKTSFEELKATFTDIGPEIKDLESSIPLVIQSYNARGREITEAKESVTRLESEKTTLERSLRDASAAKDTQIANLQRQVSDEGENATKKQAELESRIEALRTSNAELDAEIRRLRGEMDDVARKHSQERAIWETRTKETRSVLAFLDEPEAADGKVLEASNDLALGWINIGSKNRLARGTRFRVVPGGGREGRVKAWAEVTDVKPDMSEVRFYDVADRFDPVAAGDEVYNPVYDPRGERKAVLVGRFSGSFNEKELKALLENMGIQVQNRLDVTTDYLIVGSELWTDEKGEPLEEPVQPSELPLYKEAEAQGVQIVALKDLYSYFKY